MSLKQNKANSHVITAWKGEEFYGFLAYPNGGIYRRGSSDQFVFSLDRSKAVIFPSYRGTNSAEYEIRHMAKGSILTYKIEKWGEL